VDTQMVSRQMDEKKKDRLCVNDVMILHSGDASDEQLEQAKKEERERIATIASFTVTLTRDTKSVIVGKSDWDRLWVALMEEADAK